MEKLVWRSGKRVKAGCQPSLKGSVGACMIRSVAVFYSVQSCMSSFPPNIYLDGSPTVSFAFSFLISIYLCI